MHCWSQFAPRVRTSIFITASRHNWWCRFRRHKSRKSPCDRALLPGCPLLSDLAVLLSASRKPLPCERSQGYAIENLRAGEGGLEPSSPTLARSCSCFNALPQVIGAVYKKRAGYSADITMTQRCETKIRLKNRTSI